MPLTNAEKQAQFRKKNAELGRTEMRGLFASSKEQVILKALCRDKLKELRKSHN